MGLLDLIIAEADEDWEATASRSWPPIPIEDAEQAQIRPLIALAAMEPASARIN